MPLGFHIHLHVHSWKCRHEMYIPLFNRLQRPFIPTSSPSSPFLYLLRVLHSHMFSMPTSSPFPCLLYPFHSYNSSALSIPTSFPLSRLLMCHIFSMPTSLPCSSFLYILYLFKSHLFSLAIILLPSLLISGVTESNDKHQSFLEPRKDPGE